MATAVLPAGYDSPAEDGPVTIDLKSPGLAALLAWLVPGLGHIYQGRTAKGLLFLICVLGTFISGMWIGSGKVVYASPPGQDPWRWQYYCQLGVGLPALPAIIQERRFETHQPLLWNGFMAPPKNGPADMIDESGNRAQQPSEIGKWTIEGHPRFEIGTVYTVIAGLLNLIVICDAFAGPLVLKSESTPKESTDDEGPPGSKSS